MSNLTWPQLLRYFLIGFVLIGLIYICEPCCAKALYGKLGKEGTPILALVIGTLFFCCYRSIIYGVGILRLIDRFHQDNVRSLLMEWYTIDSWYSAEAFWNVVKGAKLGNQLKNVDIGSAGTHLLYMTAIRLLQNI